MEVNITHLSLRPASQKEVSSLAKEKQEKIEKDLVQMVTRLSLHPVLKSTATRKNEIEKISMKYLR